jgi:formylglycine-generating enzyme required for sulfatase activity
MAKRATALGAAVLILAACGVCAAHAAEKRVALVIGNANYEKKPLANPGNDAQDMAAALRELEFEVIERTDLTRDQMRKAILEFDDRLQGAQVGLFYYSGHGMQLDGRNYLIPLGVAARSAAEMKVEAVDVADVLARLEGADTKVNVVILDACRDNPYWSFSRSQAQGLAAVDAPEGTLIAYATAPGKRAEDGSGRNGTYTAALLQHMREPGVKVEEVFKEVRNTVKSATRGEQLPWEASSLTGDFYFKTGALTPGATSAPAAPAQGDRDLAFWESVKDSQNPADYEAYLAQFPKGTFAVLAGNRLAELKTKNNTPVAVAMGPTPLVVQGEVTPSDMVEVPGGEFFMGCNERVDSECLDNEKPGRGEYVGPFRIDKTEVTVAAFRRCVEAGECSAQGLTMPFGGDPMKEQPEWAPYCNWGKSGREDHPINCVDWSQAQAYCAWAGKRLPTEKEWEKAARGTDGQKYSWGNMGYEAVGKKVANIADESAKRTYPDWKVAEGYDDGYVGTAPVGSFLAGASPYGALDMIGNVWEWVADEIGSGRGLRGGSWDSKPMLARASDRYWLDPRWRDGNFGFRCAQ